jgi:hypothetical protein
VFTHIHTHIFCQTALPYSSSASMQELYAPTYEL